MSLQNDTSKVSYTGNNSAITPYVIPFYFLENTHIVVVVIDGDGQETTLVYGTDYALTGEGNESGGTMTTAIAYNNSNTVVIRRDVPVTQLINYDEADEFPAEAQEQALDKLTMIAQQQQRNIGNVIRVSDNGNPLNELIRKANTVIGFNVNKQPITYTSDELASFLNLGDAQQFDRPIKTVADAGERALATPDYTGQLLTQRDTGEIYISGSTTQGDWDLYVPDVADPSGLLPAGGTSGQSIVKQSNSDFDYAWQDPVDITGNKSLNGACANLRIDRLSATTIALNVDEIVFNVGDSSVRFTSPSQKIVDIDASGLNGLDTGTKAINTWYYIYYISNGITLAGLFSLSSSNPTLPAGYTYKAMVGAIRNPSTNIFRNFNQRGNRVWTDELFPFSGNGVTTNTALSISDYVPPIAIIANGNAGNTANATLWVNVSATLSGPVARNYGQPLGNRTNESWKSHTRFEVPLFTAQTIYWYAPTTGASYQISIDGWSIGTVGSISGGSSGSSQNDYAASSPAANSSTLTLSKTLETISEMTWDVTIAGGSSDYTKPLVLDTTGCRKGDIGNVMLHFPASTHPTLTIRNATSGGTILWGPQSGSSAQTLDIYPRFVYTGTQFTPAGFF